MRIDQAYKSEQRIVEALGNKPLTGSAFSENMCGTNLCSALVHPSSIKHPTELRSYNLPSLQKKNPSLGLRA